MESVIKKILIENNWNETDYVLMKDNYTIKLKKYYSKTHNIPSQKILEDLSVFYNMKIRYETKNGLKRVLFFSTRKIKQHRSLFIKEQARKFQVGEVYYIADIDPGYYEVWIDNNEGVWVDFEKEIYYYGNNLFQGIINIINNKPVLSILP